MSPRAISCIDGADRKRYPAMVFNAVLAISLMEEDS